jgi:hypothetical protein
MIEMQVVNDTVAACLIQQLQASAFTDTKKPQT